MNLHDKDPMPFGKHKGVVMEEVPASYLHWVWNNLDRSGAVGRYISTRMSALQQEARDLKWGDVPIKKPDESYKPSHLKDGLYQVTTDKFVAGFVVRDGRVDHSECAPILRKNLKYWVAQSIWVGPIPETITEDSLFTTL